ncbi:MAG: metallophosphoesterase [Gammaproteobacteria bacterium]
MTAGRFYTRQIAVLASLGLALLFAFPQHATSAESQWQGVERIVAVGDVHGDFDNFVATLRAADLINRRRNWTGGATHLVQVGDLPDRGPDTDKVIELLKKLERQAEEDGGKVHALIGNHEAMNMLGDLRYVHPDEYDAFRDRNSRELRNRFYANHIQQRQAADPEFIADSDYRKTFDAQFPLGYVEHRFAWAPEGEIGSWVLEHNAVVKINRSLFLHGGISPQILGMSLDQINGQIRAELAGGLGEEPGLSEADHGPLWYRGLAQGSAAEELAHVEAVLAFYEVDRIIIGHTPGLGTIVPRFGGKVLIIDSGMSDYYGGYAASLEILQTEDGSEINTLQAGERTAIPPGEEAVLDYFEHMATLLPDAPAALQQHINQLRQPDLAVEPPQQVPD